MSFFWYYIAKRYGILFAYIIIMISIMYPFIFDFEMFKEPTKTTNSSFPNAILGVTQERNPRFFIGEEETEKTFDYRFCVTGLEKEKVDVKIKNNHIFIFESESKTHFASCRICSECQKLDYSKIKASLKNGILTVSFEKNPTNYKVFVD